LGDHTKKEELDGACSTYRTEETMYRVLVEEPEGKNYFEDLSTGMRVTLKRILKKQDSSGLGKGKLTGSCECFKFHIMAGIP